MFDEFLDKVVELRRRGESFAIAVVVRFEAPISGKPGDKAIVYPDGRIWGWIGGGCSQPVVIEEAQKAMRDGSPRLIRISPSAEPENGIIDYAMACHSGGTLDIYIEPVLSKPQIIILGRSAVAQTLAKLAKAIDYSITVIAPGALKEQFPGVEAIRDKLSIDPATITAQTFIVVSTQGENDEEGLELALTAKAAYVAFVASKPKIQKVFEYLQGRGISRTDLDRVHAPAGIQIGAVSPEEIAVSILAEVVQARRTEKSQTSASNAQPKPQVTVSGQAKDPVCGMTVDTTNPRHSSQHKQQTVYFCCARCKETYDKEPGRYMDR